MFGLNSILSKYSPDSYTTDTRYLSIYRVLFCCAFMLFVGLPSYTWIGTVVEYLYRPPGFSVALLHDGFPSVYFLGAITVINLLLFILMFFGIWCKWSSILFSVTTIIGQTYWYSFGQVDHYLLWMITPALLGPAGWGEYFSVVKKRDTVTTRVDNSIYIQLLALCIGFSMFTSGLQKIGGDWLHWAYEGTRFNFISKAFEFDTRGPLVDLALGIKSSLIWKLLDYITIVMEIGFLAAVWRRKWFNYFVAVAFVFHVLVVLLFNIRFFSNIIVYLVFVDWKAIDKSLGLSKLFTNDNVQRRFVTVLFSLAAVLFIYWAWCAFTQPEALRSRSVGEMLFAAFTQVHNAYQASLDALFIVATLMMCFISWVYVKRLAKPA